MDRSAVLIVDHLFGVGAADGVVPPDAVLNVWVGLAKPDWRPPAAAADVVDEGVAEDRDRVPVVGDRREPEIGC